LIEGQRLGVAILIEQNSHGLRDNKPTGMNYNSVLLDLFKKL